MELTNNPRGLTPVTVATAIERIVSACRPLAIFAFGSRARGEALPDSDVDLFVLLPAPATDNGALRRRLRGLLADLPFSKDVLVSDAEAFARSRTRLNNVFQDIAADGIALWRDGRMQPAALQEICR